MKSLISDLKSYFNDLKKQDLPFYFACGYIVFSYLRPQAIYPVIDILPWTQLCIVLGLTTSVINRQFRFGSANVLMLFFFFAVHLSIFFSLYPEISKAKSDVVLIWLVEVLFFVNCIKNSQQLKLVLILFFLVIFKMSFFGARTWVSRGFGFTKWGIAGPTGFFANSGEFSLLMAMVAVLSIGFLVGFNKHKSLYVLLPITAIMTVMGASSRGSQLAIVVGLFYLAVAYRKISVKYFLVFFILGFLGYNLLPDEQLERFRSMGSDNTSQSRLEYWEAGLDMMKEYPWLGIGYYSFPEHYYRNYKIVDPNSYLSQRKEVAHNSYIEIGSTMGVIGLMSYLSLLGAVYLSSKSIRKKAKRMDNKPWQTHLAIGLQASLLVYMVGSTFMSVAFYPFIYLLLMFAYLNRRLFEN